MKVVNKIIKEKHKIVVQIESLDELDGVKIQALIPKNARSIEIEYKDKDKLLIIDYLARLQITKEENKDGKYIK